MFSQICSIVFRFENQFVFSIFGHYIKIGVYTSISQKHFDMRMMEIDSRVESGQRLKGRRCFQPHFIKRAAQPILIDRFSWILYKNCKFLLCSSKPEYKIKLSRKDSVVIKTVDYLLQSIGLVLKSGLNILHSSDHFNKRVMKVDSGMEAG